MKTAFSILPTRFEDGRHTAIEKGLQAIGYEMVRDPDPRPRHADDVLVSWTRHRGHKEAKCRRFEQAGCRVIIAEEPHLKGIPPGLSERLYCLCLHDHQVGPWYVGGPERWDSFGLEIKPWRGESRADDLVLVREQRGIGSERMRSPDGWHEDAMRRLRKHTGRPIQLRPHPKKEKQAGRRIVPLAEHRDRCHALVTWHSHDGTQALLEGIPVLSEAPHSFFAACAAHSLADIEAPRRPERLDMFRRLAWAHWTKKEMAAGRPFDLMLNRMSEAA